MIWDVKKESNFRLHVQHIMLLIHWSSEEHGKIETTSEWAARVAIEDDTASASYQEKTGRHEEGGAPAPAASAPPFERSRDGIDGPIDILPAKRCVQGSPQRLSRRALVWHTHQVESSTRRSVSPSPSPLDSAAHNSDLRPAARREDD